MGAIHVLDPKIEWRSGIPWISTGKGWQRAVAAWRHNGTSWVRFWQHITDPPRAPEMYVTRSNKTLRVGMRLRGPYPAKIIRAVVKVGINKKPTANSPLGNDGTYYSVPSSSNPDNLWSEFWVARRPDIMQGGSFLEGDKQFPITGIKAIPDGATVHIAGWIQDEFKQWSQVGTTSIVMPKAPAPPAPKPSPNQKPPTPKPTKKTYTDTFSMSWFRSYNGSNNPYSWANNAGRAIQGRYLAENGITRSLIGFKDFRGQIGDVKSIEFYVYMDHWYYHGGGTLVVGLHGHKSAPAKYQAGINGAVNVAYTSRGQGKWFTLPSKYLSRFHSGAMRGISFFINSTSVSYYGYANASRTRMRITHVK